MSTLYELSIERLIIEDVIATLQSVTEANGWQSTVGAVYEGKFSPLEVEWDPDARTFVAVNLVASLITERVPQTLRRQIQLDLHVWVDAPPDEAGELLDDLKSDIEEALQKDDRRGGLAETTFLTNQEFVYVVATERLRGVVLPYSIDFRTSLRSPRQTAA